MAGSEFPLTLVLQVQDDMSSSLSNAASSIQEVDTAAQNAERSTGTLESRVKTTNTNFLQLGLGIASAAGGIINLVRQYHNLQRAKRNITLFTNREKTAQLNLTNAQKNLADVIAEYGENSEEAQKARDKLTKAERAAESAGIRLKNAQVNLNDRMLDFAVSIVPSVVGVVAGLAQTFQILGNATGGFGGAMLRFIGPLAIVGAALIAIKFNLFGFRDAVQALGFQIGQAIPGLQPFLNFIQDAGVVFGLLPGDVNAARESMNGFLGDAAEFGQKAFAKLSEIANLFISGDIEGAINEIKNSFKKLFDLTIGQIKIDGLTVEQWILGLKTLWQVEAKASGPWQATITTAEVIFEEFIWPNFTPEAKKGLSLLHADIKAVFEDPNMGGLGKILVDFGTLIEPVVEKQDKENKDTVFGKWFIAESAKWQETFTQEYNKLSNFIMNFMETTPLIPEGMKFLPEQEVLTPGEAKLWFDAHILAPIADTWFNTVVPAWEDIVKTNPIMQKLVVGDVMGVATLAVADISKWFNTNVLTPLGTAYGITKAAVESFIKKSPIMQKLVVGDIMGAVNTLLTDIGTWFTDNIITPLEDEWEKLKGNQTLKDLWGFLSLLKSDPLAALGQLFGGGGADKNFSTKVWLGGPQGDLGVGDPGVLGGGLGKRGQNSIDPFMQIPISGQEQSELGQVNKEGKDLSPLQAELMAVELLIAAYKSLQISLTQTAIAFAQLTLSMTTLTQMFLLLNQHFVLTNTGIQLMVLNMTLLIQGLLLVNQNLLLLNLQFLLLNQSFLLLNQQFLLLNVSLLLFNTSLLLLNTQLITLILSTNLWILANNLLSISILTLTINVVTLTLANTLLALGITQLTINTAALTLANALLILTLTLLTTKTIAQIAANNTFAQTIVQLTINTNALTAAIVTATKATVAMTKATTQATSAIKASGSAAKSTASAYNSLASAAAKAAAAIKKLNAARSSGGRSVGAQHGFSGIVSAPTRFTVGEGHKPEFVYVEPLTGHGKGKVLSQGGAGVHHAGGPKLSGGGGGTTVVNVFLDGEQVRGKIVQAIVKGQAAYT